jgi:hypothetical protein
LSPVVMEALKERLRDPVGLAHYGEIHQWVEQEHGQRIKYRTLHRIVHDRLKARPKVPRPSHVKKNRRRRSFRRSPTS